MAWMCLGLFCAFLLSGRWRRMIRNAVEENSLINGKLNEIVEDQNVLLGSLNNKYSVEQKRWNLQLSNRDTKIDELTNRLKTVDITTNNFKKEVANRDAQISDLRTQINQRDQRINTELQGRIDQLERDLHLSEQELETQTVEWNNLLGEKEDLILQLRENSGNNQELTNRINDLERVLGERDVQLAELRQEKEYHERDINELLAARDDELNRLRAEVGNQGGLVNKMAELEVLLSEKNTEIDSLKDAQHRKIEELEDLLGERESAIVALQSDLSENDELRSEQGRIRDLETEISRLKREISAKSDHISQLQQLSSSPDGETTNKRIEELEYLLWERDGQIEDLQKEKNELDEKLREGGTSSERVQELERNLGEKDNELSSLHHEKGDLMERIRELEWLLGERDGELEKIRHEVGDLDNKLRTHDQFSSRVEELERSLREREGELERWWSENEALKNQLREKETLVDSLSREDTAHKRLQELEWLVSERDAEIDRLRAEKTHPRPSTDDLLYRLRDLERRRVGDFTDKSTLEDRVKELERALDDRDRSTHSPTRLSQSELEARVRDLERQLDEPDEIDQLQARIRELERSLDRR